MAEAPPTPPAGQWQQDSEHLRLLSILYYVSAGLTVLAVLFGLLYVVVGVGVGLVAISGNADREAMVFSLVFVGCGLVVMALAGLMAACQFLAGRWVAEGRNWLFVMVVAALSCLNMPMGTALGVFTFVVLSRDSVKRRFEGNAYPSRNV